MLAELCCQELVPDLMCDDIVLFVFLHHMIHRDFKTCTCNNAVTKEESSAGTTMQCFHNAKLSSWLMQLDVNCHSDGCKFLYPKEAPQDVSRLLQDTHVPLIQRNWALA